MGSLNVGLHRDVPMRDYIAGPCAEPSLGKGTMHRLVTMTPAHARWHHPMLNPLCPPDDSSRGDIGTAVHAQILGQGEVVYAAPEFQDWRKKEVQGWRDGEREKGNIPLLDHSKPYVEGAASAAHKLLATLPGWKTAEAQTEGTMIWKHGKTWKHGRFDIMHEASGYMVDVKTCDSADPEKWIRSSLMGSGYDIQAEHYLDGMRVLGFEPHDFLFLLVEIEPPFACSFVGLDPAYSDLAKRKIMYATNLWQECIDANNWPGYSAVPHYAEPVAWAEGAFADREAYPFKVQA